MMAERIPDLGSGGSKGGCVHLTIEIPDQVAAQLRERAAAIGVSAEELAQQKLEHEFREAPPAESVQVEPLIERLARVWMVHL